MSPSRWLIGTLLTTALFAATAVATDSASSAPDVQRLLAQSSFVFVGTVKTLKASTVEIVGATDSTVVVHVDDVVYNADVVADVAGHDITVVLRAAGEVREGEHAVFYSNVNTYGESVVVDEVAHAAASKDELESLRAQAKAYQERIPAERLQARVTQADLIVTGTITSVRPTPETQQRPPMSEHDPQWWEATLKPQSTEKGPAQKSDLTLYFPHSDDIRWFSSPKFTAGQQGVFLLHRTEDAGIRVKGLTALDAQDFQALEQRANVQKLVGAAR